MDDKTRNNQTEAYGENLEEGKSLEFGIKKQAPAESKEKKEEAKAVSDQIFDNNHKNLGGEKTNNFFKNFR
jgi:hypothetical protein